MTVKAENLSKLYQRKAGTFCAVQAATLEIRTGETAVLMGRSGSGKTTLFNMLSGLLTPTEGKVWYGSTDLYSLRDRALSRLRCETIGTVPQGRSAIDTLTVLENILLPSQLCGLPLPTDAAQQWMERLEIGHLQDARPAQLSGGELRRMAIARALSQDPEFLFADEPTGDLDDGTTQLVLSAFHEYAHDKKKAVFIVSHDSDALKYADRVYRMDNGRLTDLHE